MYDATYYQNNPDKVSARRRNREAREVGAEGVHTDEDIAHIREEQNGLCYYCEVVLEPDFHVDHKQPLSRGGSNWPSNLCCACPTCNISKGDKTEAEFWGYLEIAGRMSEIEERRRLREVKRVTVME